MDKLESLLRKSPLTNAQRAELWDTFETANDADQLAKRLEAFPVHKSVKAGLWDLKAETQSPAPEVKIQTPDVLPNLPKQDVPMIPTMGGGAAAWDATKRFAGGAAEMLNPVSMAQGLGQMVAHPIATIVDPMARNAVRAYDLGKEGRYSEAIGHGAASVLPVVGPLAAQIGEDVGQTGDVARGLGQAAGMIVGGKLIEGAVPKMGSGVKPGVRTAVEFSKNNKAVISEAAKNAVKEYLTTESGAVKSAIKGTAKAVQERSGKAPEPVPEAPKPPRETISAPETPKEPAKATESPKKPSVEAGDDLEGALKASLDKKDVVYAPPAFPGQQGARGATKARFEMVAERNKSPQRAVMSEIERASANVKKWVKSNTKPEKIKDRLNSIFKGKRSFSTEEVETLIKIAQENE